MDSWIVVVDDETFSLTSVKAILGAENMKISCLRSGRDLLRFMKKNTPDLILLDVMMPDMDGFETYEELRAQEKSMGIHNTPVIFLTGDLSDEDESRGLQLGASDYIHKPFDKDILIGRIKKTISNSKKIESLTEDATIDKLTGFLNRSEGIAKIRDLCNDKTGACMMLDLDNFKFVNDLYGHDTGDHMIMAFADIIRRNIRSSDVVCRFGGDEFLAFFVGVENEEAIASLSKRLNDQLVSESNDIMGKEHGIPIGISIGAVMVPQQGREYETVFERADEALYASKQNGKHGYAVYRRPDDNNEDDRNAGYVLGRITTILEEHSETAGPVFLGTEVFVTVYRFVMRFKKRYKAEVIKAMFVVTPRDGEGDEDYEETVKKFGEILKKLLRRSDIVLQYKPNQFFVLLPAGDKPDGEKVMQRIMTEWEKQGLDRYAEISHAVENC